MIRKTGPQIKSGDKVKQDEIEVQIRIVCVC